MNTIMNELRQNVMTAENNLREMASQQIASKQEDAPEYQMTMHNISILKQIRDILGENTDTSTNTNPDANADTDTHTELPEAIDCLTMGSDLRKKKLSSMTIDSNTYDIKSLKDIAIGLGEHLVKNNYQTLVANENAFKSSVTGKPFASTKKENVDCENPAEIKFGRRAFYIDTTRALANNMTLLKKMAVSSGINLNEVKFASV